MSEFNQTSFLGGMNLLSDDTRLQPNQYRLGINVRNRYDTLDEIPNSELDVSLPNLITHPIQEIVTFGNYIILFAGGSAYYRYYDAFGWTQIAGFAMSPIAPRYWTVQIPVGTTNYVRVAAALTGTTVVSSSTGLVTQQNPVSGASGGNMPGLLVQDNINQPQFIFINTSNQIEVRVTQTYAEWAVSYTPSTGVMTLDEREYVPVGNTMAWVDGILYIASQDFNTIYRSVSGRPLDFVVNVNVAGAVGGDATTTSYSVGVGGITSLRALADGSLFVSAGNANFSVAKNMTQNAPTMWGEYTFIRRFLFEATCMSDRSIIDSLGDTRFIDLTGVRSFNAIQQLNNEGRNSLFTANIQAAFKGVVQDTTAAILFDNYEFYAVNTVYGPAIAVYDTIAGCWSSFDLSQTGGSKIKQFAKIELGIQRLFAITEDDQFYTLYSGSDYAPGLVLTGAVSANTLLQGEQVSKTRFEIKPCDFRCIISRINQDSVAKLTPIVDNRVSAMVSAVEKHITYIAPSLVYSGTLPLPDIDTQLTNLYFPLPNCEQGWKVAMLLEWTGGGSITQYSMTFTDKTPMNPLNTQATTK